ncbi:2-amino-4-hydroxy-6-hydroxymethyldihydropteridine diphosphokinase [Crocinitomix catalasitica]|nr:2-amino-4-hydroxy-6-hydroxymethyldihydropteridine diphosphokinase [Crocinitomix catalasitica]
METEIYIAIGSNLGDREGNFMKAFTMIEREVGIILKKSSFLRTEPEGFDSSEQFLNAVLLAKTGLSAAEAMKTVKNIEKSMGRVNSDKERYFDRIIDLDIIDYGGEVFETNGLILPHPRMHLRSFVLIPLAEIDSEWLHPRLNRTISDLIKSLPSEAL